MERALMFTADELIICVTPRAPGSELALSGKNRRPFQPRSHGVQAGFTVRNPTLRNFLFFSSKSVETSLRTSARQHYSSK